MNINFNYYHFGSFLAKTQIDESLYHDICADVKNKVWPNRIDYQPLLAGKIKDEYGFNDSLKAKYENLLKPYIIEYVKHLMTDWHGVTQETMSDPDSKEYNVLSHLHNLEITGIWANFQKRLEYNPIHTHGGDISFVLYINVPEEIYHEVNISRGNPNGTIAFSDRLPLKQEREILSSTSRGLRDLLDPIASTEALFPINGDLYIFPAHLHHSVESFQSDVTRVTVSGNWMLP